MKILFSEGRLLKDEKGRRKNRVLYSSLNMHFEQLIEMMLILWTANYNYRCSLHYSTSMLQHVACYWEQLKICIVFYTAERVCTVLRVRTYSRCSTQLIVNISSYAANWIYAVLNNINIPDVPSYVAQRQFSCARAGFTSQGPLTPSHGGIV